MAGTGKHHGADEIIRLLHRAIIQPALRACLFHGLYDFDASYRAILAEHIEGSSVVMSCGLSIKL